MKVPDFTGHQAEIIRIWRHADVVGEKVGIVLLCEDVRCSAAVTEVNHHHGGHLGGIRRYLRGSGDTVVAGKNYEGRVSECRRRANSLNRRAPGRQIFQTPESTRGFSQSRLSKKCLGACVFIDGRNDKIHRGFSVARCVGSRSGRPATTRKVSSISCASCAFV